jgi:hypothetical protein
MHFIGRRLAAIGLLAFGVVGCAGQDRVVRLDQSESVAAPFEDILILAVYSDADARRDYEVELVRALRASGTGAHYSLEFMRSSEEINRETLVRVAAEAGVDAILVTRPIDIDRRVEEGSELDAAAIDAQGNTPLSRYFYYYSIQFADPEQAGLIATAVLESDLYRVADEELVWQVQSTAKDRTSVFELALGQARALTAAMRQDGIIR